MRGSMRRKQKIGVLVVALVVMVLGGVLFVGAMAGWFGSAKVELSSEYYCEEECTGEVISLSTEEYEEMIAAKKSFVLFITQPGCYTGEKMRGYVANYADEYDLKVFEMMFSDTKKTSLYPSVKHYPSVAVISEGKLVDALRTDSDEDAPAYNDEGEFGKWMGERVKVFGERL